MASDVSLKNALMRVAALYRNAPPQHRHYVSAKLRSDPLSEELFEFARSRPSLGHVLDAGCGRGQFGLLLAALSQVDSLVGFDLGAQKVKAARIAAESFRESKEPFESTPALHFREDDLVSAEMGSPDTLLLLDVLHYISVSEQNALLVRACAALAEGGHLLVRENNHRAGLGSILAACLERFGRALGINQGRTMEFQPPEQIEALLRAQGLDVELRKPRGALQNVLLVARKPKSAPH